MLHESLRKVELFRDVSHEVLDELISRGSTHHVPAGEELVTQGHHDGGLHVLLEGTASVYVNGGEVARLHAGDYFGEMAMIDGQPHSATVVSGPDGAHMFMVSPATFKDLLESHPQVVHPLLKSLTARIRGLDAELF